MLLNLPKQRVILNQHEVLVDAQLPPLLCTISKNTGQDAIHIDELPQGDEASDKEISEYANKHELIVISKDIDFYHSHMIVNVPKKLLLVTTGNIKNKMLFDLFRKHSNDIQSLFESCNYVELNNEGLIGHE